MVSKHKEKHIYGPVPSRRLGFSLGIDVIPFKTCSYDCIYCQLVRTTNKTITREEYYPVKEILMELAHHLERVEKIDYITLAGSGEPTLYLELEKLIFEIKQLSDIPVAVITNGSLLGNADVCQGLKRADLVIPSLDAGSENIFHYVNRPYQGLDFDGVVQGITDFSCKYKNKLWLEVFLLNGVTSIQSEVLSINRIIKKMKPQKIQLNTVRRPSAESYAFTLAENQIQELAKYIDGNVEVIANFKRQKHTKNYHAVKEDIINLLKRRPCSLEDIAGGLNLHKNEIIKYLEQLIRSDEIFTYAHDNNHFYSVKKYQGKS